MEATAEELEIPIHTETVQIMPSGIILRICPSLKDFGKKHQNQQSKVQVADSALQMIIDSLLTRGPGQKYQISIQGSAPVSLSTIWAIFLSKFPLSSTAVAWKRVSPNSQNTTPKTQGKCLCWFTDSFANVDQVQYLATHLLDLCTMLEDLLLAGHPHAVILD